MSDDTKVGWAVIEQLGHKRMAGYVREEELAGHGFLRVDVYAKEVEDPIATQYISPGSVYAITPTTEDVCRRLGASLRPEPVSRWELPAPEPERPLWAGDGLSDADAEEYAGDAEDDGIPY